MNILNPSYSIIAQVVEAIAARNVVALYQEAWEHPTVETLER